MNQEELKEYKKEWAKKNHKSVKISGWKNKLKLQLTDDEWSDLYDRWMKCENCECCGKKFDINLVKKSFNDKQLDHCHKTMKFRNFLCSKCNRIRANVDNHYQTIMKLMTM